MGVMELQEFRFRGGRIALALTLTWLALGVGAVAIRVYLPPALQGPAILGSICLVLFVLTAFRWRSRIRIDRDGIQWRSSGRGLGTRLEWEEVDELFLLGPLDFELRGAGKAVRVSGLYRDPDRARRLVSARLGDLRDRLRARALRDAELVFRMPTRRWKAHASYLLAILVLTIVTGLLLAPILHRGRFGFPGFIVLFGGTWLWGLRRRASRMGTVVTLYRDGLVVQRLDGRDRVAWSEIAASEWDRKGGLELRLGSGRTIPLPPSLGNISLLEEFVEEGRQGAAQR
jgi:hypothetical protein